MRVWMRASIVALAVLGVVGPAVAQETTGTITGTVTDQTGAVLPGVTVTARNVGTGSSRDFVTSSSGSYTASFLTPGQYEVTFALAGFQSSTARNILLHVNDRLQVDGRLGLGEMTATVDVTAAAQLVQPTATVQSLMGATQVNELPLNNRNFVQLATLVPGVTSDLSDEVGVGLTSTVSISVNGLRRNAVSWFVDGAANVDIGSKITLLSTPTLESIEEFKILTSSYAAEWSSAGGVINVATKSGSNDFRVSAYEFFRNDALNANSFFRKQSSTPEIRDNPPRLRYNNYGFTVGGPIKKDRFHFFYSQEWRKISRAPVSASATVPAPAWLTDPSNANYVAPAQRDPNAVRLLAAFPAPNVGANGYSEVRPNDQDTRQEVIRLDYAVNPSWNLMGRYTHDLSVTEEPGGLFFNTALPGIATTSTRVPGQVFVLKSTNTLSSTVLNELSYQFSANDITSSNPDGTRNRREDYGLQIPELFPGNPAGIIPFVTISGLSQVGSNQLFDIEYRNHSIADNLSIQRGNHSFKVGGIASMEQKNENANSATQGNFVFSAGGGFTAFQNFLRGNAGGACGAACTYTEADTDVVNHLRFGRFEFYVQDSWKARPGLTIDYGVRYSLFPAIKDRDDVLTNFDPSEFDPAQAPRFSSTAGTALLIGTGDPLNGIVVAGVNSPYGRGIYPTDKNNFAPRLGISWDPKADGRMIVRGGFGVYYDPPLVGIFEQNAFVNPPFANTVQILNPSLSNPGSGTTATTTGVRNLIASAPEFETPRTMQWNVGVQRQLYSKGVIDVGYVGSRGDNLIYPIEINQPQPQDVVRLGALNPARPYPGYGTITFRDTIAKSRYHGLLFNFRHEGGRNGLLNVAYTLSRNKANASNDRDAIDFPQNPLDLAAEYAIARTDRTHVFSANYVYELPFFRESKSAFLKNTLGGWQVSGITTLQSGPPISRVVTTNDGGRRGIRPNQVSDPFANVPANVPGGVYWFNPAAFAPAASGAYGTTGRAIFRLPGRNQWDITLSKNWYPSTKTRLQFRADLINAFNHTQLDPASIQNTCPATATPATTCDPRALGLVNAATGVPTNPFGQITNTRSPREIQLGIKFYWQ